MSSHHIPYHITGIIIGRMNKNIKFLLDDEILLRFIIRYCCIHPETLLIWFVKQQRQQALLLYTSIKTNEVLVISDNVIILLCKIAIKNDNIHILKHLIHVYLQRLKDNNNIFITIVNFIIEVYLKKNYVNLIKYLKYLIQLDIEYVINIRLLIKVLEKDKSKELVKLLYNKQCIYLDMVDTKVINYIIIYNHLNLLKFLVCNGCEITNLNIIIGISSANWRMIRYIITHFKPRLYTKGFRRMLLSIAAERNDKAIYKYVYERLK